MRISSFEKNREVVRDVLHYGIGIIVPVGIHCGELSTVQKILQENPSQNLNIAPTKQRMFSENLKEALNGICSFESEYNVGNYRIDLFCKEFQLAIEYDEIYHRYSLAADEIREKIISSIIPDITFIRVKQGHEFSALNKILLFVLNRKT
jgi:very-short-patch-repair endonuclease